MKNSIITDELKSLKKTEVMEAWFHICSNLFITNRKLKEMINK